MFFNGDKVRVVKSVHPDYDYTIGQEGTVDEVRTQDGTIIVYLPADDSYYICVPEELELITE